MLQGTPFGNYQLLDLLGRGGMGEVWRAYDTVTDRVVALKVLSEHLTRDETFQQRFRREAHSAAKLTEPHVVPIHTYGEIDGRLFVDMRLIEGRDLHAVLNDGPLDPVRAVLIVEQIAQALHAAHSVGLVHRDVKPSNILVADHDFAYLIDFGIARGSDHVGLTDTGNMIGTWHYMAPERLRAGAVDSRSDVYALACVLHECLTGTWPYPGDSVENQVAAHLTEPPPQPSASRAGLPPELDDVVATGMAKSPDERYSTTVELAQAARGAVGDVSSPHLPQASPRHASPFQATQAAPQQNSAPWWRRRAVVITAVAAAAVAVTATVAVPLLLPEDNRQATLAFGDLNGSSGVAVAGDHTVFVTDRDNRVLRLPAGTSTPSELPFTRLISPFGAAVDAAGTVYVADTGRDQVLKLPAGASTPEPLPFTGLAGPTGVAVDADGTVYVADSGNDRVLSLAVGATDPTVLAFTGIDNPVGVAVGDDGTVLVADAAHNRVVSLEAGQESQLSFTSLTKPAGVAVSTDGTVYVADSGNNRVLALSEGATAPTQLPFDGLRSPQGLALDDDGTVYVADSGNNRVVTLRKE